MTTQAQTQASTKTAPRRRPGRPPSETTKARQLITIDRDLLDWLRTQPDGISGTLNKLAKAARSGQVRL